jgi:hypothetical protein
LFFSSHAYNLILALETIGEWCKATAFDTPHTLSHEYEFLMAKSNNPQWKKGTILDGKEQQFLMGKKQQLLSINCGAMVANKLRSKRCNKILPKLVVLKNENSPEG